MQTLTNGTKQVYSDLGMILDHPEFFGLGRRAPQRLVASLTRMRDQLREDLMETNEWSPGDLPAELSQDTDTPSVVPAKTRHSA